MRNNGSVLRAVGFHRGLCAAHRKPVVEATAQELGDEFRVAEIEGAEVEHPTWPLARLNEDGVVAELEKRMLARAKGQGIDGQIVPWLGVGVGPGTQRSKRNGRGDMEEEDRSSHRTSPFAPGTTSTS